MRLTTYIQNNIEQIAIEWERFAETLPAHQVFSPALLRDGIVAILEAIVADMEAGQSGHPQQVKAEGASSIAADIANAAERHALFHVKMGLSAQQLIAEFRVLRATVIRLWQRRVIAFDEVAIYDLTRFNEAIDQALSEAAGRHTGEIERSRELFLGVLGHDLRNPVAAISGWAELQMRSRAAEGAVVFARQIYTCAGRLGHLITDLIELARVGLGEGIIVHPCRTDLQQICTTVILEMEAIYPDREFRLHCPNALRGVWDGPRLAQLLSNLLANAVQHGALDAAIMLTARRDGDWVEVSVRNGGTPIPEALMPRLFDRLVHMAAEGDDEDHSMKAATGLGLGLYIAREIVVAHGGTINVTSDAATGTIFTARMPWEVGAG